MADYISALTGQQMDDALIQMNQRLPEQWTKGTIDGVDVPPDNPRYHNNAKYYAELAEGSLPHAPKIENGTWWVWDVESGQYVDTEVSATGGVTSVNEQTGEVVLDADDISDSGTINKFTNATEKANWNGKSEKAISFTITLTVAGWSNNEQTISDARFLTTDYDYIVGSADSSFEACVEAGIRALEVTTNGQMTFTCKDVPTNNLTINIVRMEVA